MGQMIQPLPEGTFQAAILRRHFIQPGFTTKNCSKKAETCETFERLFPYH